MTRPDNQLPAIIEPAAVPIPADTYIAPARIAGLGYQANWRYVEFFAANVNNDHTRRAYARACSRFLPGAKIADCRSSPSGRSTSPPG
jgi:hypothetical protein